MRLKAASDLRLISVSIALLATFFASCGVSKNNSYWRTVQAYKIAPPVPHEEYSSMSRWDSEATLPSGTRVAVKACYCGPSEESRITLKYSDEERERVVYGYKDYVYPADIRIEGTVMHAIVSGVAGGIWPQSRLIVYDLARRKKLRELKIDPKDLEPRP